MVGGSPRQRHCFINCDAFAGVIAVSTALKEEWRAPNRYAGQSPELTAAAGTATVASAAHPAAARIMEHLLDVFDTGPRMTTSPSKDPVCGERITPIGPREAFNRAGRRGTCLAATTP